MKKTLADFKRDIDTGMHIEYVKLEERLYSNVTMDYEGEFIERPIPEKMQGVRYVSYKDTTGFYLKRPDDKSAKGSFCGYPKASELEYDGDTFTITEVGRTKAWQRRHYKIISYK